MKHWPSVAIDLSGEFGYFLGWRASRPHAASPPSVRKGFAFPASLLKPFGEAAPRRCGRDARGPSKLLELFFETFELFAQSFELSLKSFHFAF
jgi:hypothetical protein